MSEQEKAQGEAPHTVRWHAIASSTGPSAEHWAIGDPRELWPHENAFHRWLVGNLDMLAHCLGLESLEFTGREVVVGEQALTYDARGRSRWTGGLRLDLAARDEHGRQVVVEAQFGEGDHEHFGKTIAYAYTVGADVAVWVVVGTDPVFHAEHLGALAELNEVFAGRRQFHAVVVTLESEHRPEPPTAGVPLRPRLRRVDLISQQFVEAQ